MGGHGRRSPRTIVERIDRLVRRTIMRTIGRDTIALRAQGIRVHVLTPGPEDLAAMGVNLMDPRTRGDVLSVASGTVAAQLRVQLDRTAARGIA
jgi:NTE family protein